MESLVVVGNGMAGIAWNRSQALTQVPCHGLRDETHVNYNRILLSPCWQENARRKTSGQFLEWYQQNNVDCAWSSHRRCGRRARA